MMRLSIATIAITVCLAGAASAQQEQVLYYHTDAIGSVRVVTDANGQVVERHDYLPFGQEYLTGSTERRLFTGTEHDQETGFDYLGARYYASQTGRFTTVDPGHVGGDIFATQSWNAYAYALNNPLRFVDPMGTCSQDAKGNYFDGDDAGTLVASGPCVTTNTGALTAGITTTVTVKSKSGIVTLAEGISSGAGPVADPLFVAGFYGASALGGLGVAGAATVGAGAEAFAVTSDVLFGGMGPSMAAAISQASNPRLQRALSALYQVTDRLRGGTAAAAQFTRDTGILIGGSNHAIKATESIARLQNILRQEALTPSDQRLAEYALRQLQGR